MKCEFFCFGLIGLALASPALADNACPKRAPGASFPWQTNTSYPDDEWADLIINVDATGKPTDCKIGKHQFKPETGFWMCRAMMAQGDFRPALKDGVPTATTVTRHMRLAGRTRRAADEKARKQFFRDHPEESPRCYPE